MTHAFFQKSYRGRLVIPNKVTVKSWDDDSPSYTGSSTSAASYANMPIEETRQMTLASNAQAAAIAAAYIGNYELWCSAGSFTAPINVGLEVMDYINVVDSRGDDSRTGNIGRVAFYYDAPTERKDSRWEMVVSFGDWTTVASKLASLGITGTELQSYFTRLGVGDLYAENITADQLNVVGINASGEIRLFYAEGDLDDIADGEDWGKVAQTSITAGRIWLGAGTAVPEDNAWYVESGVIIDSGEGIKLFGDQISLRTYPTYADALADTNRQCYVDTDGKIYAGGGAVALGSTGVNIGPNKVLLSSDGIIVQGSDVMIIKTSGGVTTGYIGASSTALLLTSAAGKDLDVSAEEFTVLSVGDCLIQAGDGFSLRAGGTAPTAATDNDVRIEADADIFIDASDDIDIYSGDKMTIDATYGLSIRAGGTAPTAPTLDDLRLEADDAVYIESYGSDVYIETADDLRFTVTDDYVVTANNYRLNTLRISPASAAGLDLGSDTLYFDGVYYKTLTDKGCPAPLFKNPLADLRGMQIKKRTITLEDVEKEAMGKRAKRRVEKAGGSLEAEEWDKDTFPEEILNIPTEEDKTEAIKEHQVLLGLYNKGKLKTKPVYREPQTGVVTNDLVWLLVKANQQLADRVEVLEGGR